MAKTVVGLYDHIAQARAAVADLHDAGYERDEISFVAHAGADEYDRYFHDEVEVREGVEVRPYARERDYDEMTAGEGAAAGAGIGAAVGGIGGLLMGLGLLAVPGVGPALAAGPIVSALVGAGIGAAAGGLMGALVNSGVPEEEAGYYAEGVRRGGSLVMLTVDDARVGDVEAIMNRHDPIDIDERVGRWQDEGFETYDPKAEPYTVDEVAAERGRFDVQAAEGVYVDERPRREAHDRDIREIDANASFGDWDADAYRTHYDTSFADSGYAYETYEPAYRFGAGLARDEATRELEWGRLETDARRRWEERNPGTWDDYREAVRYSYERDRSHA